MSSALPKYFEPGYHQHNPNAADGIAGFATALQTGKLVFTYKKQYKVIGEGNLVLSISEETHRGNPAVLYIYLVTVPYSKPWAIIFSADFPCGVKSKLYILSIFPFE